MAKPNPTPQQIQAACKEIQQTWSEAEERTRRGIRKEHTPLRPQTTTARFLTRQRRDKLEA